MKNLNLANIEKLPINTKVLRNRKIINNENQQIPKKRNLNLNNKEEVRKFGRDIKNYLENLKQPKSKNKSVSSSQRIPTEKSNEENEKFKVNLYFLFIFSHKKIKIFSWKIQINYFFFDEN